MMTIDYKCIHDRQNDDRSCHNPHYAIATTDKTTMHVSVTKSSRCELCSDGSTVTVTRLMPADLSIEEPLNVGVGLAREGTAQTQLVSLSQLHRRQGLGELGCFFFNVLCKQSRRTM